MAIEINRHASGRRSNIVFGLCQAADAVVRVGSLGFLSTTWVLDYAKAQAKRRLQRATSAR